MITIDEMLTQVSYDDALMKDKVLDAAGVDAEQAFSRLQSLPVGRRMQVTAFIAQTLSERGIDPSTKLGYALAVLVVVEGIIKLVPVADRPWMIDGEVIDKEKV